MRRYPPSTSQIRCWDITVPADAEPDRPAAPLRRVVYDDPAHVRHGYTMADLDRLARLTVTSHLSWFAGGDRGDQYDAAWHGVVEHLCAVDEPPSERDLLDAGLRALQDDQQRHQQMLGTRRSSADTGRNFTRYWKWHCGPVPSPEDAIVDRLALRQIMAALNGDHAQALNTLAAVNIDAQATAQALGISYSAAKARLMRARKQFREHWFAPDAPPPMHPPRVSIPAEAWERLRAECSEGHAMTRQNTQWENRGPGRLPFGKCRRCESDRRRRRAEAARALPPIVVAEAVEGAAA